MRKAIIIGLIFLYQIVSIGITINAHYCLGYLVDVSLFTEAETCGGEINMPCCADKSISLKVDDAQNSQPILQLTVPDFVVSPIVLEPLTDDLLDSHLPFPAPIGIPPPELPSYVQYHAFIFYG